jgi:four helix bundle protein
VAARTKPGFMNLAESSLEECDYYLVLAKDLGYGDTDGLAGQLREVSRILRAYGATLLSSSAP